jgi:putative transposase
LKRWKNKFNAGGAVNLTSYQRKQDPELQASQEEIRLLKNVVARLELELEFKTNC